MVTFITPGLGSSPMCVTMPRVVLTNVTFMVVVPLAATLASWTAGGEWQGNTLKIKVLLSETTLQTTLSQPGGGELRQTRVLLSAAVASLATRGNMSQVRIRGAFGSAEGQESRLTGISVYGMRVTEIVLLWLLISRYTMPTWR